MRAAAVPSVDDRYRQASLVTIDERREPLLDLAQFGMRCVPVYFHNGWTSCTRLYARRAVCEKLADVQRRVLAPRGVRWLVWDAWRSRQTQTAIYQHYWRALSLQHPELTPDALRERVQDFVTIPDRADYAPPHTTGGSVDLGLWDDEANAPLWLGADFDEFTPDAASAAFEAAGRDETVRQWRRLMARSLASVGFSGDPNEYFHKDYGSQRWAAALNVPSAPYGEVIEVVEAPYGAPAMRLAADEPEVDRVRRIAALTLGLDLCHPAAVAAPELTAPGVLATLL